MIKDSGLNLETSAKKDKVIFLVSSILYYLHFILPVFSFYTFIPLVNLSGNLLLPFTSLSLFPFLPLSTSDQISTNA